MNDHGWELRGQLSVIMPTLAETIHDRGCKRNSRTQGSDQT